MDYGKFANFAYARVRRQFKNITNVLVEKLQRLETDGFDPENGFMFGHSFGGQIVLEAGKTYGVQKIKEIDGKT